MLRHIKKFSIEEVENLLKEINLNWDGQNAHDNNIVIEGYSVYAKSMRYKNFFKHGYTCCVCGKQGAYFYLDIDDKQNSKRAHFNLYSEDGTLMTKDHIIPKSRGGKNDIHNYQVMCSHCNEAKRNEMPEEYDPNMIKETKIKPYFYYGDQKFSSLRKAVNFALSQIVKIKGNVTPQEHYKQYRKAKRRIMAAIYEGKKYGNNEWKIKNK